MPLDRWEALSGDALSARAASAVAILPVAATEYHGPHLPLGTDSLILDGILAATDGPANALVLPTQRIGWSIEHGTFPGTLSVAPETLIAQWVEIGAWVARSGCRRLLILNAHGGNAPLLPIAALRLRTEHAMLAAHSHWQALVAPPPALDWHAGHVETSLMLHLHPALVDMSRAHAAKLSHPPETAWITPDLSPTGVIGDPTTATAAEGARYLAQAATALQTLLTRLVARKPPSLSQGGEGGGSEPPA